MTAPALECGRCGSAVPAGTRFCPVCGADTTDPGVTEPRSSLDDLRTRLAEVLRGRYVLGETLGVGGMGAVFLAEEIGLEREVAIKVLPPRLTEDPSVVARFEREARTAARLDHAHIIPIYRVESEGGLHYFVMKYVTGRPLDVFIADHGPLPVPLVVRILSEAASALDHAHRKGVVHRDIKPANILLDRDDRVLIADFGIAKALTGNAELTNTGVVIGTPYYMSPEQSLGTPVDGRSDQYSLAVVGYRMLTGEPLFDGDSSMTILYKHINAQPPRVRERRADVPEHVDLAILRALAKAPADRFESMRGFGRALRGEEPVNFEATGAVRGGGDRERDLASAATVRFETTPVPRRRGPAMAVATLGVVALVGGGLWWRGRAAPEVAAPPAAVSDTTHRTAGLAGPPADTDTSHPQPPLTRPTPSRTTAPRPVDNPAGTPEFRGAPITVNATPFGTLFIDEVRIGGTPVVNYILARGKHTIRIDREGCTPKVEQITVTAPASIKRQYTLECTP